MKRAKKKKPKQFNETMKTIKDIKVEFNKEKESLKKTNIEIKWKNQDVKQKPQR